MTSLRRKKRGIHRRPRMPKHTIPEIDPKRNITYQQLPIKRNKGKSTLWVGQKYAAIFNRYMKFL